MCVYIYRCTDTYLKALRGHHITTFKSIYVLCGSGGRWRARLCRVLASRLRAFFSGRSAARQGDEGWSGARLKVKTYLCM